MKVIARLVTWLARLTPKRETAFVFTWPAFDDTARALIPALEGTRVKGITYAAAGDIVAGGRPREWGEKVHVVAKKSWRGLWAMLRSRYVFSTHQCYTSRLPRNVCSVNVWHGMPIKRIGWLHHRGTAPCMRYELATSPFWVPIMEACMRPWGEVVVTPLPRYDRFCALTREAVCERLGGVEAREARKILLWAPTYRKTAIGDVEKDGKDWGNPVQMPDYDADDFEAFLAQRRCLCILKPHPLGPRPALRLRGHFRILDEGALRAAGITLYPLLGATDILLTDISSIYVDFLLLDRPVIHTFADCETYAASRGFTFSWGREDLGGPMVGSMAGVKQAIDAILAGRDDFAGQRGRVREKFHAPHRGSAAEALLRRIRPSLYE